MLHAEDMAVGKAQRQVLIRSEWGVRVLYFSLGAYFESLL